MDAVPRNWPAWTLDGTRELVIHRTPYIAVYLITDDSLRILRVLHGAQRWPEYMTENP
ncbi:MAG: type II toxin-antitoxin system RelE/ParE family toxin [Acidobacteriaceae bacterium]